MFLHHGNGEDCSIPIEVTIEVNAMNEPAIDMPDLLERIQYNYTLLPALMATSHDVIISRRVSLHEIHNRQRETEIRELIHLIKGAAANISASAVFNTCMRIENEAGKGYLVALEDNIAVLDRQLTELEDYIAQILSSQKNHIRE
jgi:HPt (histidine-containing phosphotransfer) domain-containing protein